MKMFSVRAYRFLRIVFQIPMRIAHPIIKVSGRENIPDGPVIMCANHSAFTDPFWVIIMAKLPCLPRTMMKKELLEVPVVRWWTQKLGGFPVDREGADVNAVKTALKTLRDGEKLIVFPEGTRIRKNKKSEPHNGPVMIANRTGAPLMPVFLSMHKQRFFSKVKVVYGEPYYPEFSSKRPSQEEMNAVAADLMRRCYALGEEK